LFIDYFPKYKGSSATDYVTDVTDLMEGRRKKEEGRRFSVIKNFLTIWGLLCFILNSCKKNGFLVGRLGK